MTDTKTCAGCGANFHRPKDTKRVSGVRWSRRRFCSPACNGRAKVRASGNNNPGASGEDAHWQSARIASGILRDRMFEYYRGVAQKRGLDDVWQAAVVLGMAA